MQKYNVLYIYKRIKIYEVYMRMCLDFMISDGHGNVIVMAIKISFSNCELDISHIIKALSDKKIMNLLVARDSNFNA